MLSTDRTTAAVVVAMLLSSFTLVPLTADLSYLGASWLFVVILGVLTAALRRARVTAAVVLALQLGTGALLSFALSFTLSWTGEPWFRHYVSIWVFGVEHMQSQGTPMEPNEGVVLIFATVMAGLMIVTDLLTSSMNRPAWGIGPIAALFLVAALGTDADTGPMSFLLVALGYLGILLADGLNTTGRWTRGLSQDSARSVRATPVVWRAAALIAVPAVLGTLVLSALLPTANLPDLRFGKGPGGNGPLQLIDPSLDLRRNLNQPQDKEVIRYRTDASTGSYLRLASLPKFDSSGWSNVDIRLSNGAQLPQVPGFSKDSGNARNTTIEVLDFQSQYLPMPYAPRAFEAEGDWRYDANSLTVVNGDNEAAALRNLSYSVSSVDVAPSAEDLADTVAGTPLDFAMTSDIPDDLPQTLLDVTRRVTEGEAGAAAKAAAIQAFLRSDAFTYSTEPLPGSGYRALENFLLKDRRGYCEQFATSMAMMARVAGIPSRVSVGFLPGTKDGDTWRVTIRNMHAWPELYFSGYGWVRFEPTPASVTGSAPPWTQVTSDSVSDDASSGPSASASPNAPSVSSAPAEAPVDPTSTISDTETLPWARTIAVTGVGLLVLALLAAPATIRVRRRTARLAEHQLAEEQVEAAWAEIRDTVLDFGGAWPSGTPHVIGTKVARGLAGEESAAIGRVATLVERSRYSRGLTDTTAAATLPALTGEIRRGIAAPLSRRRRLLGLVLPRSIFRRGRREL